MDASSLDERVHSSAGEEVARERLEDQMQRFWQRPSDGGPSALLARFGNNKIGPGTAAQISQSTVVEQNVIDSES
jgi:hypothetical protein